MSVQKVDINPPAKITIILSGHLVTRSLGEVTNGKF